RRDRPAAPAGRGRDSRHRGLPRHRPVVVPDRTGPRRRRRPAPLSLATPVHRHPAPGECMHIELSVRTLIERLRGMRRIRVLEEEIYRLRLAGEIVGSVHLCDGQEAIYVGACAALDPGRDLVFPTYRGHGWALACGASPEAVLAELLGRAT